MSIEFVDIFQHLIDKWSRVPGAKEAYEKGLYS